MRYRNAGDLLPEALVKELQRYVQGEYLYIPTDGTQRKGWGSVPAPGRCWMPATRPFARPFARASPQRHWGSSTTSPPLPFGGSSTPNKMFWAAPWHGAALFVRLWFSSVLGIAFPCWVG